MKHFIDDESGQGITEYGAILAFVAVLVALAFTNEGRLHSALSKAYDSIVNQLNAIR